VSGLDQVGRLRDEVFVEVSKKYLMVIQDADT
jgi:hypothetical protein